MIYLMRHGLDDERFIGGHSDTPLVSEGIEQVKNATKFIIEKKLSIERIISSDVKRAVETANIVNSYLGVPIEYSKMLRELDKGVLNGLLKEDALKYYKDYVFLSDKSIRYPGGESLVSFYERIKKDLNDILREDNTLIITHRGVINMIYFILSGLTLTYEKEKFGVSHGSIHEYDDSLKLIKKIY